MFCIAAFIVLAIISIFSASHRKLAKKAWDCTFRRITFRPCDSNFKDETKNWLLARVANKTPRLIKVADIGIEIASFVLVILTVWSLLSVMMSGLNLYVWGTCTPNDAAACSLGAETCSIETVSNKSLFELTKEGKPFDWFSNQASTIVNTFANIPTRLKNWDATEYLPTNVSYYYEFDDSKPTAIEILDPGCIVCSKLFNNIKSADFESNYNLAYIAYPIEKIDEPGTYNFKNSYIISSYLEAMRISPLESLEVPADWQIIEKIFSEKDEKGQSYQAHISLLSNDKTRELLEMWMNEIGYSESQITNVVTVADSEDVKRLIDANQYLVENTIRTVKIPTIIFDGKRHDGLVSVNDLK